MRTTIKVVAACLLSALAGFSAAWLPVRADPERRVLLDEYLALYCRQRPTQDRDAEAEYIGQAALLSRLSIAAGVGPLAYAASLKCRL